MKSIEIIPAVLPKSRDDVESTVARYVDTPIQTVQIDLVDGDFASPKTWPYNSKNQYAEYKFLEEEGFPGWQDIDIELDLMISNPFEMMERFIEWGPARIIVHASSVDKETYISFLKHNRSVQSFIHFGIAFSVEDAISDYQDVFPYIDFVQCMGIATIGKQAQDFDVRVLEQIKKVRSLASELLISVDGGVSPTTAPLLIEAGADRLVSGSYLAEAIDINQGIQDLVGDIFSQEM